MHQDSRQGWSPQNAASSEHRATTLAGCLLITARLLIHAQSWHAGHATVHPKKQMWWPHVNHNSCNSCIYHMLIIITAIAVYSWFKAKLWHQLKDKEIKFYSSHCLVASVYSLHEKGTSPLSRFNFSFQILLLLGVSFLRVGGGVGGGVVTG